jgi:hypothetical protein
VERNEALCDPLSFYHRNLQQQLRMSRNYNELIFDKNTDNEVPFYSIYNFKLTRKRRFDGDVRRIPTTLRVSAYQRDRSLLLYLT